MSMTIATNYGYVAYVDEAGDPGLRRVRPIDQNGASEWLVLSAVVIRAGREPDVVDWTRSIVADLGIKQRKDLHYRDLSPTRKIVAGDRIASLPLRAFAVCSNKKNMRGYVNQRAAKIPSQQWFYNWCLRLLLERVTAFCADRTMSDHGKILPIKIEFSERGGHSYSQTSAYHYYLRQQQQGDKIYLKKREPVTEMLNWDLMKEFPHGQRAGLQLADYVASAFYQAIDFLGPGLWDTRPAERLYPIIASENGSRKDFGVTLFPSRWWEAKLTPEQEKIFRFYGYEFVRW